MVAAFAAAAFFSMVDRVPPVEHSAGLANVLRERPGVLFVLPRQVPAHYAFAGPMGDVRPEGRLVTARTTLIRPANLSEQTIVFICSHTSGRAQDCEVHDHPITRRVGDVSALISFDGASPTAKDLAFWKSVVLTTELDLPWLRVDVRTR